MHWFHANAIFLASLFLVMSVSNYNGLFGYHNYSFFPSSFIFSFMVVVTSLLIPMKNHFESLVYYTFICIFSIVSIVISSIYLIKGVILYKNDELYFILNISVSIFQPFLSVAIMRPNPFKIIRSWSQEGKEKHVNNIVASTPEHKEMKIIEPLPNESLPKNEGEMEQVNKLNLKKCFEILNVPTGVSFSEVQNGYDFQLKFVELEIRLKDGVEKQEAEERLDILTLAYEVLLKFYEAKTYRAFKSFGVHPEKYHDFSEIEGAYQRLLENYSEEKIANLDEEFQIKARKQLYLIECSYQWLYRELN